MRTFIPICTTAILLICTHHAVAQQYLQTNWERPSLLQDSTPSGYVPQHLHPNSGHSFHTDLFESEHEESEFEFEEEEFESPYDEMMETDRHDFTQAPKVVGAGVLQLEYGFLYTTLEEGTKRETSYATPELLVRYGVNEKTEFRFRYNYAQKFDNEGEDISGSEDMRLGIKYQVAEQEGSRPDVAVEFLTSIPTGSSDLSTGRWEPGIDFIYGWELENGFSLAASTGLAANGYNDIALITAETDFEDDFLVWSQSLAIGKRFTEKNTGYFEWFGLFTHGREDDNGLSYLNVGFDHYFSKNMLIDFRIGWGLTSAADDLFAGIGGGMRF